MRRPFNRPNGTGSAVLWDLLTFEHLMTNQVIHLIYWAGLAIIGGSGAISGGGMSGAMATPLGWSGKKSGFGAAGCGPSGTMKSGMPAMMRRCREPFNRA